MTHQEKIINDLLREFGDDLKEQDPDRKRKLAVWAIQERPAGSEKGNGEQMLWLIEHWSEAAIELAGDPNSAEGIAARLDQLAQTSAEKATFFAHVVEENPLLAWSALTLAKEPLHEEQLYHPIQQLLEGSCLDVDIREKALDRHSYLRTSLNRLFSPYRSLSEKQAQLPWLKGLSVPKLLLYPELYDALAFWRLQEPEAFDKVFDAAFDEKPALKDAMSQVLRSIKEQTERHAMDVDFRGREDLLPFVIALANKSFDMDKAAFWLGHILTETANVMLNALLQNNFANAINGLRPLLHTRSVVAWMKVLPLECLGFLISEYPRFCAFTVLEAERLKKELLNVAEERKNYIYFQLVHGLEYQGTGGSFELVIELQAAIRGLLDETEVRAFNASEKQPSIDAARLLLLCSSNEAKRDGEDIVRDYLHHHFPWAQGGLWCNLTGLPANLVEQCSPQPILLLNAIERTGVILTGKLSEHSQLRDTFLTDILWRWLGEDKTRQALDTWLLGSGLGSLQPGQRRVLELIFRGDKRQERGFRSKLEQLKAARHKVLPPIEGMVDSDQLLRDFVPNAPSKPPWDALTPADQAALAPRLVEEAIKALQAEDRLGLCQSSVGEIPPVLQAVFYAQDQRIRGILQKKGLSVETILGSNPEWWHREDLEKRLTEAGIPQEQSSPILDSGDELLPRLLVATLHAVPIQRRHGLSWEEGDSSTLLQHIAAIGKAQPSLLARGIVKVLEKHRQDFLGGNLPWLRGLLFALGKLREPLGGKVPALLTAIEKDINIPEAFKEDAKVQRSLFNGPNIDIQREKDPKERMQQALVSLRVAAGKIAPELKVE